MTAFYRGEFAKSNPTPPHPTEAGELCCLCARVPVQPPSLLLFDEEDAPSGCVSECRKPVVWVCWELPASLFLTPLVGYSAASYNL